VLYSPSDFWSYLEDFDDFSFEHLDLFSDLRGYFEALNSVFRDHHSGK
jgi:hypothetical protein